jgi:succinate dehydrogenase / fumarate reductase iron-sulfur subunit
MNVADEARVTIYRFDPTIDKEPRLETYKVPPEVWKNRKIIDVIRYIYENFAPGLSFREPCRQNLCGCCALNVNSKSVSACSALAQQEMLIEPLAKERVIKDLVTEL